MNYQTDPQWHGFASHLIDTIFGIPSGHAERYLMLQFHLQLSHADTLDCLFPFFPFPSYTVVLIRSDLVNLTTV